MNIKFNYLYRDAGNYKVHGFVIFNNPKNIGILFVEQQIKEKLIDGAFFDPDKFQIPRLKHSDFLFDNELDHLWNEFDSVEETKELASENLSIGEFLNYLKNFK